MPTPRRNDLTAEFVRSILSYDAETGTLTWKWRPDIPDWVNRRFAGTIAAETTVSVKIRGRSYRTSRVIWLIENGVWPDQVDHRSRDQSDNSGENLREATHQLNCVNRGRRSDNTSGHKGLNQRPSGKWMARIGDGRGGLRYLGQFDSRGAAIAAYRTAAVEMFGEFACFD